MSPKSWITSVIVASAALTQSARADRPSEVYPWRLYIGYGSTFDNESRYTVKSSSGTTVLSNTVEDKASPQASIEGSYEFPRIPLGLSVISEYNEYKYSDNVPNDKAYSLFFMPKFVERQGIVTSWVGLGIGIVSTELGQTSGTSNGISVVMDKTNLVSTALSPRFGVDFSFRGRFSGGLLLSYTLTTGSIGATARSNGTTISMTEDVTRSWYSAQVRLGISLGGKVPTSRSTPSATTTDAPNPAPAPEPGPTSIPSPSPSPSAAPSTPPESPAQPQGLQDSGQDEVEQKLSRLQKLRDKGLLTEEEFKQKRKEVIDSIK